MPSIIEDAGALKVNEVYDYVIVMILLSVFLYFSRPNCLKVC